MIYRFLLAIKILYIAKIIYTSNAESVLEKLNQELNDTLVVPYFIEKISNELVNVTYKHEHNEINIIPGVLMQCEDLVNKPQLKWNTEPKTFYTLCLIDPLLLLRYDEYDEDTKGFSWLYWLVVNIPGNDVHKGYVLSEYNILVPRNVINTKDDEIIAGLHPYLFLVYKQTNGTLIELRHYNKSRSRLGFLINDFAEKHNLGFPIAGNLFKNDFRKSFSKNIS